MRQIDTSFEKTEVEVIEHMMNKLPKGYKKVITIIEGIGTNTYLPSRYRNGFVKSLMSKLLLLKEIWKSKYALNGQMGF